MAKRPKKKIIKADEIRRYVADHPKAGPTEVATALTEQTGERFTPQHVSTTLNTDKQKSGKTRNSPRKARAKQPRKGQSLSFADIDTADAQYTSHQIKIRDQISAAYSAAVDLLAVVDRELAHEIVDKVATIKERCRAD